MNREQAQAILDNIDLIRHFAEGGEIGHRLHDYTGEQVRICPTNKILLSNIERHGLTNYCKVKKRLVYDRELRCYVHRPRCWTENISEREVIK